MMRSSSGTPKSLAPLIKLTGKLRVAGGKWLLAIILLMILIMLAVWSTHCSATNKLRIPAKQPVACSSNGYNAVYYPYKDSPYQEIVLEYASGEGSSFDRFLETRIKSGGNQALVDIQGLTCLDNLEIFDTGGTGGTITNLAPLSKLINLKNLMIDDADINDLAPLSKLTKLEDLNIELNQPVDLTVLNNLKQLKRLKVCGQWVNESCSVGIVGGRIKPISQYPKEFADLVKALPQLKILFGTYTPPFR